MAARSSDADSVPDSWDGLAGLDKVLDHRVRLALCVLLTRYQTLTFRRLKDLLDETDGSLGAHLRKLEDAGFVRVRKEFRERKPVSWYALTAKGKKALQSHLQGLQGLLEEARRGGSA